MPLVGLADTQKQLEAELETLKQKGVAELRRGVNVGLETLMAATPVWTGETVANYHVNIGRSVTGGPRAADASAGDPGHTNKMSLGAEPRRPANEALPRAEMQAVLAQIGKELVDVVIGNTVSADKWDMIDNGAAPGGPPGYPLTPGQRTRAPGGVSRVAVQTIRSSGNWR